MKLSKHDETLTNLEVMSSQDIPQNLPYCFMMHVEVSTPNLLPKEK